MKKPYCRIAAIAPALVATTAVFAQQPGSQGVPPRVSFETRTMAANPTEAKILDVLEDVFRNQRQGSMSVPREDGRVLRLLAESIDAKHVVEVGTSVGYSGLWLSLALKATGGRLTTYEIDAGRAAKARANFERAGVADIVTLVEGDAHAEVVKLKEPIDMIFLDADKDGYIDYLNKLLPLLRPGGLVVAHNMSERMAHPPYVQAITTNPALETVFLNMATSGIGVTMKKR